MIRVRPTWHLLRAVRVNDQTRCVLLVPGRVTDDAAAQRVFDLIARAHEAIRHPSIPGVSARGVVAGRPTLEFDCDAVGDGLHLTARLARSATRIPYAAGDAFIVGIREVLQAAHRASPAWSLGRLSGANILFAPSGRWYVMGFGANYPIDDALGVPDATVPYFQPPEMALGGDASASGDYLALLLFVRSVIVHVDTGGAVAALLKAGLEARSTLLAESLRWVEQRVIGALPTQRATLEEGVAQAERIRALLGVSLDPAGFERIAAAAFARSRDDTPDGSALRVAGDASWVVFGSAPPQQFRGAARRILRALVERHLFGSWQPLRAVDLVELGWPDERPEYEAGLNRVYVTMNRLRRQLPEGALQRFDDGYRLAPDFSICREATGPR